MCRRKKVEQRSQMKSGKDKGKATDVILRDLETKLLVYLDEWRWELGIRNGLEVSIDREELCLAAAEREDQRC